jgi:CubicO group peptidase (beta-lactamase class C family)
VYERYFGEGAREVALECGSVTKSFVGLLAMVLIHEKVLDDAKFIPHYLPELRGTAWEDATLRQVMDMETGLAYREDTQDKSSDLWPYRYSTGRWPRPAGYTGPRCTYDYLRTVRKAGDHGAAFAYKSVNTDVIGWTITRATGLSFAELMRQHLWKPLGCEEDGYITIDEAGVPLAAGGLSLTARDLARIGELLRCEGDWKWQAGRSCHCHSRSAAWRRSGQICSRTRTLAHFARGLLP